MVKLVAIIPVMSVIAVVAENIEKPLAAKRRIVVYN
jgi:hypothetical protein